MASKKKESEGIALLSMYNDDDEMEDVEEQQQGQEEHEQQAYGEKDDTELLWSSTPQLPQSAVSSSPMLLQDMQVDTFARRTGALAIVDYGHDEAAMSPEAEEGEIEESGRVTLGDNILGTNGDLDKTSPGTVRVLTPNNLATPQFSESPHYGSTNYMMVDSEAAKVEEIVAEEKKDADPLDRFLPPPPIEKCSEDLQRKINKFLEYKKAGKSFNAEVRNRKDYRNPDFLLHAVSYQDIDQIGSCFNKDVFDPHGYDKSDYYTEIEVDMKREMERKELERKRSPKVEFVPGGTQPSTVITTSRINMTFSGVSAVPASGLHSAAPASDGIPRDGRQNKKSKWDKVDGDRRNPVASSGSDAFSAHAALLSSANVGSGYTAFAQQRRREAEEKRSSERKLERRT